MNGMVTNEWPYVVASYVVTWIVLVGYTLRLVTMTRRNAALRAQTKEGR